MSPLISMVRTIIVTVVTIFVKFVVVIIFCNIIISNSSYVVNVIVIIIVTIVTTTSFIASIIVILKPSASPSSSSFSTSFLFYCQALEVRRFHPNVCKPTVSRPCCSSATLQLRSHPGLGKRRSIVRQYYCMGTLPLKRGTPIVAGFFFENATATAWPARISR